MKNVLAKLQQLSNVPDIGTDEFNEWLKHNNAMKFLFENLEDDWVVIYSGIDNVFIHGVLVPERAFKPLNTDDLLQWEGSPCSGWRVGSADSDTPIEPPLASFGNKALAKGEQVIFIRQPEDGLDMQRYVEINQKIVHSLKLHYRHDQQAWFRPDKNGDVKPFIKIVEQDSGFIVVLDRDLLSAYAAITNAVLVRMFEIPSYHEAGEFPHMHYRVSKTNRGEHYRGVQLLKSAMPQKQAVEMIDTKYESKQEHETFLALDWWHSKQLVKISYSSDTYKLLPAFFRQEVLSKYKFDQNKYSFSEYSVGEDGKWDLRYSINDEGQVHAWLIDIGKIPYDEQKYLKLYNEEPKPAITNFNQEPEQILSSVLEKGFYEAAIKGSWDYTRRSISLLKDTLYELDNTQCPWWKKSKDDCIVKINYPIVKSFNDSEDWGREIQMLSGLLVEGLQESWLKSKAQELQVDIEDIGGSLNLLEKCLIGLGHQDTKEIIVPLRYLKKLRNKTSPAHPQIKESDKLVAEKLKSEALAKHGNYWKHYDHLVGQCDDIFRKLAEVFGQQKLESGEQKPKNANNTYIWADWIAKCHDPDMRSMLKKLRELSLAPSNADSYSKWIEASDVMSFLAENAKSKWIVAYLCSSPPSSAIVYSAFVPKVAVNPTDIDDLLKWPDNHRKGWRVYYDEPQAETVLPLTETGHGSKTLAQGEQLVFTRTDNEDQSYVEILQKFAHVIGIHRGTQQSIRYKIGSNGKKEPVVRVLMNKEECVVLFRKDTLSTYAKLTNSMMVRVFCFKKISDKFIGWGRRSTHADYVTADNKRIHYHYCLIPNYASDSNGFQLVEFDLPQ